MREYDVARIWGIPIRVHVSLLVILPVLAYLIGSGEQIDVYAGIIESLSGTTLDTAVLREGTTPWIIGSVAAVALFVSVLLHELGHSWMAMRYGLEVESITLWILGGLANLGSIPREWKKEFWIAVAGPAVSVAVGVVCYLVLFAVPGSADVTTFVVGWLAVTNLTLAVFNMVPAFPMDGGRVLRALLARNRPYVSATRTAARIGSGFAILFAVVGILPPIQPMFLLLALFIYGAANSESRMVALSDLLDGVTVDSLVERDLPQFDAEMSAFDALVELDGNRATEALVADAAGTRVITRADFAAAMEMRRLVGTHEPF